MACDASIPAPHQREADYNMWHMYQRYWKPFGKLLTDMEKEGMLVNRCVRHRHFVPRSLLHRGSFERSRRDLQQDVQL